MNIISIINYNIIIIFILISVIKGEHVSLSFNYLFSIYYIKVNKNIIKAKIYRNREKNKIDFECNQGDKIFLNISSKNISSMKQNEIKLFLIFKEENITYYFTDKNISLTNKIDNLAIEFTIPYKIYCKSYDDIIIDNTNLINFNLNSYIFIKNSSVQEIEKLRIKISDIKYSNNFSHLVLINFNKSSNYELNKTFQINLIDEIPKNSSMIIKYKGIINDNLESINECSINIQKDNKRCLQEIDPSQYYYTFGEIFDNIDAIENMDDIVEFLNQDINVFNISEDFFQDICHHYERDKKDYVLEDRVEFFYQNYSLCNTSCNLSKIYFENFSFSCLCWPEVNQENEHHKKKHSSFF